MVVFIFTDYINLKEDDFGNKFNYSFIYILIN